MNVFMDPETWTLGSLRRLTGCTTGDESCFQLEVEKTIIECLIFEILKVKKNTMVGFNIILHYALLLIFLIVFQLCEMIY